MFPLSRFSGIFARIHILMLTTNRPPTTRGREITVSQPFIRLPVLLTLVFLLDGEETSLEFNPFPPKKNQQILDSSKL